MTIDIKPSALQPSALQPSALQPDVDAEIALQQAQQAYKKGHWAEAIMHCKAAIAQCQSYLQAPPPATEPPVTEPITKPKLVADATKADIYAAKGELFASQGQLNEAIDAYQQAAEHRPGQAGLQAKLADLHSQLGETYLQRSQTLKQKGDIAGAVRTYLTALQRQPRLFVAYSRLRYNLMRYDLPKGDPLFAEIASVFQSIVQQQPALLPARVTLGYALTKSGQIAEAIDCFREAGDRITRRQLSTQLSAQSSNQSADLSSAQSVDLLPDRHAPDFIIIGAEKCGTTSLHQYLRQHPAVLPSIEKEIDFFDLEYDCGVDWYLAHFPAMPAVATNPDAEPTSQPKFITGETSANYLYDNQAPARIFKHFPQIKLAVILRHPIDRTLSRYSMMVRNGAEKRSFEVAIAEEISLIEQATTADGSIPWPLLNRCRHIGNSLYYHHLKRWLAIFPRQQLLVLKSEDLFSQPAQTLKQLYETLGLPDYPEQTYEKYNVGSYRPLEGSIRQTLADFFGPHTQKLETLLGQSFEWNDTAVKTDQKRIGEQP